MQNDEELWQSIATGPHDATWVWVKLADGREVRAHWASDLSGSEQPAFQGWFERSGNGFVEVVPVSWRPLPRKLGGDA